MINLSGQALLSNPSFEGKPSDATMPRGWQSCSQGTTPDILPGFWGVYKKPAHGNSYLGLITRHYGSFESIGQRMSKSCKAGSCYKSSVRLAAAESYAGFNAPLQLRIWLGNERGERAQLIFTSPSISHEEWKAYTFEFIPEKEYSYIVIEAFAESKNNYRGSILIDKLKSFDLCKKA